ncbi:threonylcarbamoyl-AMP synthase YrdC [Natronomonas pharaonis DSM 2160]|uniref:L-threonylcarbamoyladenylate synthase n=1 Tax=Natronomonas pharaonis (strain ATCC 35678 / DSM 2160 / CIP 103997 / JCM 8858 / NBRC 14720 / NCIMB 2260 / Gabara) TaxID=348780 RepID=A0A1U7EUX6_NATPD|nr:L-threonylcarbamoyladenylate synthase [Natronomonas pharaonis]CAI48801.1 threonylcarbamoyl-AMP synthase YrdC [Natronomonas pharaonis DSM 2160]
MTAPDLTDAVAALRRGDLVVYPTETVYGLAADALDPEAVKRVFEAKGRDRDKPVSMALPSVAAAAEYVTFSDRERAFCEAFLPGPVTVLLERGDRVPDVLVAGRDRVGLRVPAHDIARDLARRVGPITATSANVSGNPSARRPEAVDATIRERAVVVDGGETPGTESTVVDIAADDIVRRGAQADDIDAWLTEH